MHGAGSIYFAALQGYVINETELYNKSICTDPLEVKYDQRTIGPENAHLKPDLGVLSHNEMTLTLNTHTPLLTS